MQYTLKYVFLYYVLNGDGSKVAKYDDLNNHCISLCCKYIPTICSQHWQHFILASYEGFVAMSNQIANVQAKCVFKIGIEFNWLVQCRIGMTKITSEWAWVSHRYEERFLMAQTDNSIKQRSLYETWKHRSHCQY